MGLAVALASVDRDWPTRTKGTGFGSAAAGAVIGAWLGFHATDGLLVLLTPVVGANLALIALDITRDRSAGPVPTVPRRGPRSKPTAPPAQPGNVASRRAADPSRPAG